MNRPAKFAVVMAAILLAGSTGCARWKPKQTSLTAMACMYDRADLTYQIDASQLRLPLAVSKVEAQHVSYQETLTSSEPGSSTGTLMIKYPHPQGMMETALAEVIIDSRGSSGKLDDTIHEVWNWDFSKNELDRVVGRLRDTNYFKGPAATQSGVKLATNLDGVTVHKAWTQVPELNLLMQQVRSQGQLVAYHRPAVGLSAMASAQQSNSRLGRMFSKSNSKTNAGNYAAAGPTQPIKYDPPPASLPNPIYAGAGAQTPPVVAYNPPPAVAYNAPVVQTAAALGPPAAEAALPGVSISGANAVYSGRSVAKQDNTPNISQAAQSAMAQQSQNNSMQNGMGGGGGGF